ncbi:MAG: hypothetical protein U5K54_20845 [Cytophagales bacterium]|nr:hypothetical protein [Cytophagales bacterium]
MESSIFSYSYISKTGSNKKSPEGGGLFSFFVVYSTNRFSFKSRKGLIKKVKEIKSAVVHKVFNTATKKYEIFGFCKKGLDFFWKEFLKLTFVSRPETV